MLPVFATVLLLFAITSLSSSSQTEVSDKLETDADHSPTIISTCPPGYERKNKSVDCSCIHGKWNDILECNKGANNSSSMLKLGYCITYSGGEDLYLGSCPYVEYRNVQNGYIALPENISDLNEYMCGKYNRKGLLCSECKEGFGPVAYSYNHVCVRCFHHVKYMALYLALEFLPITFLYVIFLLFQVNVSTAPFNACLFFYQIIVNYIRVHSAYGTMQGHYYGVFQTLLGIYGIFNLDFFRYIVPHFCVSHQLRLADLKLLEYVSALYPLVLIFLTYMLITLHDHNFRPIVWLWKPFHKCFVYQRHRYNGKASIIDVFATFLLLSFAKIISVSIDIVMPLSIYDVASGKNVRITPYFAPNNSYGYNVYHIVLATFILFFLVVCPVLLLTLYHTRVAQRCTRCLKIRQWHALRTFIEAFQGDYKDGTVEGQRDMRFTSSIYLVLRIVVIGGMAIISIRKIHSEIINPIVMVVLITSSLFFVIVRPYKDNRKNVMDSLILALMQLQLFWILTLSYREVGYTMKLMLLTTTVPLVGLVGYGLYRLILYIKTAHRLNTAVKDNDKDGCHEKLPDRLVNPAFYSLKSQQESK